MCLLAATAGASQLPAPGTPPAAEARKAASADASALLLDDYFVRDTLMEDGRAERRIEARVHVKTSAGVTQASQLSYVFAEGLSEVEFERVDIVKPDGMRVDARKSAVQDV